jgi:hypothetical protein
MTQNEYKKKIIDNAMEVFDPEVFPENAIKCFRMVMEQVFEAGGHGAVSQQAEVSNRKVLEA